MVLRQIWQELPEFLKPAFFLGEERNTGNFTGRHPRFWLASLQGVVRTFNCKKKKKCIPHAMWSGTWVSITKTWISFSPGTDSLCDCANVISLRGFPGLASELACPCRRLNRHRFDPGLGRPPGVGNDNPLQYSCLENPMDREAWWATVHGVPKSQTWLSNWAHSVQSLWACFLWEWWIIKCYFLGLSWRFTEIIIRIREANSSVYWVNQCLLIYCFIFHNSH